MRDSHRVREGGCNLPFIGQQVAVGGSRMRRERLPFPELSAGERGFARAACLHEDSGQPGVEREALQRPPERRHATV